MVIAVIIVSLMNNRGMVNDESSRLVSLWTEQALPISGIPRGISIVVELSDENSDLGSALSMLAFAKMLQIEAETKHQINTEVILTKEPNVLLRDCFPSIMSQVRILQDPEEVVARSAQQKTNMGSKAVFLEPTGDKWEDGLELLKISYQQTDGEITLPFIHLSQHQPTPAMHQWRHLRELVDFVKLDEAQCCTLPHALPSDSVLMLEDDTQLQPEQAPLLFQHGNKSSDHVTIVYTNATVPSIYAPLRNASLVPHPIHRDVPGGLSVVSRYCLAQNAIRELVGLAGSPLTMWAAFTSHYNAASSNTTASIRLLSKTLPPKMSYDKDDPRAYISLELLPSLSKSHESQVTPAPPQNDATLASTPSPQETAAEPNNSTATSKSRRGPLGSPTNTLTIVIHNSGEMGNHLSKLTYGYAIQWILQEEHNITTEILLQHQDASKWVKAAENVQRCFPVSRGWSFGAANTDEFKVRKQQQERWMRSKNDYFHFNPVCDQQECIRDKLDFIVKNLHNATGIPTTEDNYNISLPYIYSDDYATISYFNDRYAQRIKEFWQFDVDNPDCCAVMADPDESVLHIRNFLIEMPRRGRRKGYEELSPHKVANELFGHLNAGDKVAFTSRLPAEYMINYTTALEARGLKVRVTEGQNPMQDFCFLLSARKEFAGFSMSSYAVWAAYLGNATKSRVYSVKSPDRIARLGEDGYFFRYNWTDPTMQENVVFEEYNSEEQDTVEKKQKSKLRRVRL